MNTNKHTPEQIEQSRKLRYAEILRDYLPEYEQVEVTVARRTRYPDGRVKHAIAAILGGKVFYANEQNYEVALRSIVQDYRHAQEEAHKDTYLPTVHISAVNTPFVDYVPDKLSESIFNMCAEIANPYQYKTI